MFVNTFSADGKYPFQYCRNSQLPIQMLVSEKQKNFHTFLLSFCNLHQILSILKKKIMVLANVFLKLLTVKNFVTPLCKKHRFGTRLDSRNVKVPKILAKSPWECFYYLFSSIWRKLIWKISPLGLGEI